MIIPELIQKECNSKNINLELEKIINSKDYRASIKDEVGSALQELSVDSPSSHVAAKAVIKAVKKQK